MLRLLNCSNCVTLDDSFNAETLKLLLETNKSSNIVIPGTLLEVWRTLDIGDDRPDTI